MLHDLTFGGVIAVGIYYIYNKVSFILIGVSWDFSGICCYIEVISYAAHLHPLPHFILSFFLFNFISLLGGSFLLCTPLDGSRHTLALTKTLGKQANIARARYVKPYFRLFRYVNRYVNARWSM